MQADKLIQTGSQTVGPFFHFAMIAGGENILVNENTLGDQILITGKVIDGDGEPVPDAMLEIWQADHAGLFNHPADINRTNADPNFRGFGRSDTRNNDSYSFHTIKPGSIIGTTGAPYINIRVFSRGMLTHAITRLYFSDEESNDADPVLKSIPANRRQTLIAQRLPSTGLVTYRFDIRLQGHDETVFFNP